MPRPLAAWAALPTVNRQLYRLRQPPGTPLPDPSPDQYEEASEAVGFAAFVLSHVLALAIGAWPSVLLVSAVVAVVTWTRADAHTGHVGLA